MVGRSIAQGVVVSEERCVSIFGVSVSVRELIAMSIVLRAQKRHQFDTILLAFLQILCTEVRFCVAFRVNLCYK
jgi:hypothetical protein